jgi:magnesium-transporting ATPase (P-type)
METFTDWQFWVGTIIGGIIVYYITKYFDSFISKISKSYKTKIEKRDEKDKDTAEKMLNRLDSYIKFQNDFLFKMIEKRLMTQIFLILAIVSPVLFYIFERISYILFFVLFIILCLVYVLFLKASLRAKRLEKIQKYYDAFADLAPPKKKESTTIKNGIDIFQKK